MNTHNKEGAERLFQRQQPKPAPTSYEQEQSAKNSHVPFPTRRRQLRLEIRNSRVNFTNGAPTNVTQVTSKTANEMLKYRGFLKSSQPFMATTTRMQIPIAVVHSQTDVGA